MGNLGDPQRELKFIHVAGTNGKGSVSAMLSAILTCGGCRTGLFTSPHLERVHERFRVNGEEISDGDLISLAERVREAAAGLEEEPTEFERLTAMGLLYFRERKCGIVVLEVGLGGRLDATNVIRCPEAAVLMNIGPDHTAVLGNTLSEIAWEKAGIVKPGGTVVAYPGPREALEVFRAVCGERGASLRVASESPRVLSSGLEGQRFSWGPYEELRLNLLGPHQLRNAAAALETVGALREKGWRISPQSVREGLERVEWPGRMEVLSRSPLFLLDGAHNVQCVEAMVRTLRELLPGRRFVFLTGVLADKDRRMLELTFPCAARYLCVTPESERALPGSELAEWLRGQGQRAEAYESVDAALREVLALSGEAAAFGSLYLAGAVRGSFRRLRGADGN